MTCKPKYVGKFVNVYLIDRAYGGPEEGGWYYDCGEAIASKQYHTQEGADKALEGRLQWCEEENRHRRSDTSSVLSEGCYVARVEDEPAKDYPDTRPHYE